MDFLTTPLWLQVWQMKMVHIVFFSIFLLIIIAIMLLKDSLSMRRRLLSALKYIIPIIAFFYIGLTLKAQPTTTNIIIMINALRELQFPMGLFLLEPFIFLSFVFIFLTIIMWGRGVFCGWLCPYGAMTELLSTLYKKIFPRFRFISLPERLHGRLIYLKYVIFFLILGVSFYSFTLSEYMTEIEPFKTFILKLKREWYFVLYFMLITAGSIIFYRAFCRYLCPLGAALAIPSLLRRIPLIRLRRYDFCSTCRICSRTCNLQAIGSNGVISSSECLACLDCQINFWDEEVCPLLRKKRRAEKRMSDDKGSEPLEIDNLSYAPLTKVIFMAFIVSSVLLIPLSINAKTISVPNDYPTINEALMYAGDGDTIEVKPGEYMERIRIEKRIHIRGIDRPVIRSSRGNLIEITASDVIIEGLTLTYDTPELRSTDTAIYIEKGADRVIIRNNNFLNVIFGIWNVEGNGLRIENNTITGIKDIETNYRGNCINLTGSEGVYVSGNELSYCRDGIYIELSHDAHVIKNRIRGSRYSVHTMWADRGHFNENITHDNLVGLAIMYSRNPEIRGNLSYGNSTHGLLIIQSVRGNITDNIVIANTKGLFLYNSIYNEIRGNLIMNNQLGIHSWGGSEDNMIKENSIISNEVQVKYVAGSSQEWNGNYWSDYIGWDMDKDGIGDNPYESSSFVDYIFWRYPIAKVLYASPALHMLWLLEKQFPIFNVLRIVDKMPSMRAFHPDWMDLKERYASYEPSRIYGDISKIETMGGGF